MKTIWRSLLPLGGLAFSFVLASALLIWGHGLFQWLNPMLLTYKVDSAPGGVHGSDLVADLLTITALTMSVCVAYVCLPSDRLEIRIATYTRMSLAEHLIEEEKYIKFYASLDKSKRTPSCKLIRGFLAPRAGIGGWHEMSEEDVSSVLGPAEWNRLRLYVNDHLDEFWIKVQLFALSLAMTYGFYVLFRRYFGFDDMYFSSQELAAIVFLLLANIFAGFLLIFLSLGGHTGERSVRTRIKNCVDEIKGAVQDFQAERRDEGLDKLGKNLSRSARRPQSP